MTTGFQSTLPHGERRGFRHEGVKYDKFQSTLPHGERREEPYSVYNVLCFNPRSRTGSDVIFVLNLLKMDPFQSTLPHGERLRGTEGAWDETHVSIHAPARGATVATIHLPVGNCVSIHAPARGATYQSNS